MKMLCNVELIVISALFQNLAELCNSNERKLKVVIIGLLHAG